MAYKHNTVTIAKQQLVIRLGYIIRHLQRGKITQRELAQLAKVSPSVISSIANEHSERLSLGMIMKVADMLRLKYSVTFESTNGRCVVKVTAESALDYVKATKPSYLSNVFKQTLGF
ncbi:helix-turn-helix domain-containing protein [Escherichia coli]|uniref:helix-turn-helix domain-containing protein n=1 Tax=Escherichia coli TaxID=562 RepID=UPI000A11DA3E|nr:helix-turn-helix transcriptional regulator [Escherichia coli]ORS89618.1 hypothetical protein BHS87_26945 [Escherichia coli]